MATEGDVLRVAAKLQEAALCSQAWPEALSSFGALFGSTWTVLGAFDRDPGAGFSLVTQDAAGDSDHLALFRNHYNTPDTNPALKRLAVARPGTVLRREQTFSNRAWTHEPFYRDIYRPRGLYHGIGLSVVNNESQLAIIGLNRPRPAGSFSEREINAMRQAMPHLQQALEVCKRLAVTDAANRAHEAAWDLLGCGTLLLDRSGKLLWANAKAQALLAHGEGLILRNGFLSTAVARDAAPLASAIGDALLARRALCARPGGALRVSRRSGKRALSVLVSPLRVERCFLSTPAAIVFVTDPDWKPRAPVDTYRRLYGLTKREAAVAASLALGAGLAETAAALDVSIHTVRTHLRALFRKTETRRQGELVALLARATFGLG